MLYPTAGCRLYIANAPMPGNGGGALPSAGWVEIGETEAIGLLGSQSDIETADVYSDGALVEHAVKSVRRRSEMPIIMANNPTDPGQLVLWTADQSEESYPFRLVFPDGVTSRSWWALVIGMGEVFDAANSVIKLQADIKPTSGITRSEGA